MKSNKSLRIVIVVIVVLAAIWYLLSQRSSVQEDALQQVAPEINNTVETSVTVVAPDEQ